MFTDRTTRMGKIKNSSSYCLLLPEQGALFIA